MPLPDPIDWGAAQTAISKWVRDVTGLETQWQGDPNAPQLAPPWISLGVLSTRDLGRPERRKVPQLMREVITVVSETAVAYVVTVDDVAYQVAGPFPDLTAARDALISELAPLADLVVEADDVDQLRITGTQERPHFHVAVSPIPELDHVTTSSAIAHSSVTPVELVARIRIETASHKPGEAARSYAAKIRTSLGLPGYLETLREGGLAFVRVQASQDLSQLVGSTMRTLAVVDVAFWLTAEARQDAPWVREASASGSLT